MATEIEVISVGIQANLEGLKSQLNQAAQMVGQKKFPEKSISVGAHVNQASVNAAKRNINNQLRGQMERNLEFKAKITASTTSLRGLITEATKSLRAGEGIAIPIKADLRSAQALNADITKKIGTVKVGLEWYWKNGPPTVDDISVGVGGPGGGGGGGRRGGGGTSSPAGSTPTAHEKAVNKNAAEQTANALSRTQRPVQSRAQTGVTRGAQAGALGTALVPVEGLGRISNLVNKLAKNASKTEGALTNREFLDAGAALKWLDEYIAKTYTSSPGGAKKYGRATGAKRGPGTTSDAYLNEAAAANVLRKRLTSLLYGTSGTPDAIKSGYRLQLRQLEKNDPEEFDRLVNPYIEKRGGKGLGKNPSETKIKNQGIADFAADLFKSVQGPAISYPGGSKKESGVEEFLRTGSERSARNRGQMNTAISAAMSPEERARMTGPNSIQPITPLLDLQSKYGIGRVLQMGGAAGPYSSIFEKSGIEEANRAAQELIAGGPLGTGPTGSISGTPGFAALRANMTHGYGPHTTGLGPLPGQAPIGTTPRLRSLPPTDPNNPFGLNLTSGGKPVGLARSKYSMLPGRAGGGPASNGMYLVGEKGPEVLEMRGGGGYVHPLTGRASGGSVGAYNIRGRSGFGSAFTKHDVLTGGDVQRVFVVNMPAGGFGAAQAGGPINFTPAQAQAYANQFPGMAAAMGMPAGGPGGAGGAGGRGGRGGRGAAAAGGGGGGGAAKPARDVPVSEEALAQIEINIREATLQSRKLVVLQKAGVRADIAGAAVRSAGPAGGQALATKLGRGKIIERQAILEFVEREATQAGAKAASISAKIGRKQVQLAGTADPTQIQKYTDKINDLVLAEGKWSDRQRALVGQASVLAKSVASTGDKFKVFGANVTGIVAGTLLFSSAMSAVQAGLAALVQGGGPLLERATGFTATAARITSHMSDVFRQSGGQTGAIAGAAGVTGISAAAYGRISPLIVQRSQVEAGNKALVEQLDLLHTAEQLRSQGQGKYDKGLLNTTGGFLGTALGGVPSVAEQYRNEIATLPSLADITANKGAQSYLSAQPGGQSLTDALTQALMPGPGGVGIGGYPNFAAMAGPAGNTQAAAQAIDEFSLKMTKGAERLVYFNDQAKKGGTALEILQDTTGTQTQAVNDTVKAFNDIGQTELAQKARESGLYLKGGAISGDTLQQFFAGVNRGSQTASPELVLQSMQREIQATIHGIRASANLQRGMLIPGQFALGELAQPTPGTQGVPFESGLTGKGDKAATHAANVYKTKVGGAVDYVNQEIDKGRQALMDLVPTDLQGEFKDILDEITNTGKQISQISLGAQQAQVNLAVHEYNNQLRLARRSLQDAKDLQAGLAGATSKTLGGLEGQNAALQRQLQLLGFELQQRQINYQVALAGFVAPGSTPGERAARIEEAKIEAAYAQKQLDLQEKIAKNQYTVIHIQAGREVYDLTRQIALLSEGRAVTINTAAAQRALDILNKKQSLLVQKAGVFIQEGVQIAQAAISATVEVERQTGKAFDYVLGQTANAWGIFGEQAEAILSALRGTAPGKQPNGQQGRHIQAPGYFGSFSTRTNFTVGEAGSETVAILRNARSMSMPTGGGGGVNIGGITIIIQGGGGGAGQSMVEMDHWATLLARKVEERLSRKLALLGSRSALSST